MNCGMGKFYLTASLIVTKCLCIRRRQSAGILFIATLLLTSVILALLDVASVSKTTTPISDNEHQNADSGDINNKDVELNVIYQIRNQRIKEVCKKVKTTRPIFVKNRNAKVPLSFWLKNWTNYSSGNKYIIKS